ncbi:MAG: M14-type cytosolic carboxypeptidase, partial [Gammaproteobacteria bacterium]
MIVSSQFDGGNIECLDAGDAQNILLRIRTDKQSDFYQWFYFRAANVRDIACRYVIDNAAGAAYVRGWEGYRAVASYDREYWFRVDTRFDGNQLVIEHTSAQDQVYFAYFAPYSMERHGDLLAFAQGSGHCRIETLGETLDGQALDCLRFGEPTSAKKTLWMVA